MPPPLPMQFLVAMVAFVSFSVPTIVGWQQQTPLLGRYHSDCCRWKPYSTGRLLSSSSSDVSLQGSDDMDAEKLSRQARKLRQEIEEFEKKKGDMEKAQRDEIRSEIETKQALMDQYSVVVPILKPDGTTVQEKIQFTPRLDAITGEKGSSRMVVCEASLPLGILLGEHERLEGMTEVDEVAAGSNGEAAGIQKGDLLRACTACKVEMDQPTWQLMVGGIGRPKTVRYMFSTDFKPFELVMEAVGSNRLDPEGRPVVLVLERSSAR